MRGRGIFLFACFFIRRPNIRNRCTVCDAVDMPQADRVCANCLRRCGRCGLNGCHCGLDACILEWHLRRMMANPLVLFRRPPRW